MNNIYNFLKRYLVVITILITVSIVLSMSYSNFIVTSENHKVAEMYIGTLKYSMAIDGSTTNTLSVPAGETIVDITITNENPIDTYYKLIYENNSNVTIQYYESAYDLDNSNNISKTYNKANDKITSNNTNTIKLKIINNSDFSQNIVFKVIGGFATNTLEDVIITTGYTIINAYGTQNVNTYFCTTADSLTQGLQYTNGQYTYAYKQEVSSEYDSDLRKFITTWTDMSSEGWGVGLTDRTSTDTIASKVCTYINKKPIVSMTHMFYNSQATSIDTNKLNTSNVINMSNMFDGAEAETLNLNSFDTSNVTAMNSMFAWSKATSLDLSNFDTSKVTDMSSMFSGSRAASLNLSKFDTLNVTDMNRMFYASQATILDISNFDTSNVTDMSYMFQESQATSLDLSNFNTSKVTNMQEMFHDSQAVDLNLSSFDTSKVTTMGYMFFGIQTPVLDLSSFDTSNVTTMYGMFWTSPVKTIYVSDKFTVDNLTSFGRARMFSRCKNLVGGAGTAHSDGDDDGANFAHIDGGTSNPGYFTDIADKPKEPESFATDSWPTIANAVRNGNTGKYNVGDTKTIDTGTYGTHTLRIANTSTPSECSTTGFSQSACGFVLEFADIITTYKMNNTNTNVGGWPASAMYTFISNNIYNALPSDLKNVIIDTTVVSGHGAKSGETNFTTTDKLYLLAPAEIYTSFTSSYDTAINTTRQLDYYKSMIKYTGMSYTTYNEAIKKNGTVAAYWWLREARSDGSSYFFVISPTSGGPSGGTSNDAYGVSPAFRIG